MRLYLSSQIKRKNPYAFRVRRQTAEESQKTGHPPVWLLLRANVSDARHPKRPRSKQRNAAARPNRWPPFLFVSTHNQTRTRPMPDMLLTQPTHNIRKKKCKKAKPSPLRGSGWGCTPGIS
ncbi:hypothetical protein ARMA_2454 [Ardenticatena maritima]|uniref:Uncharacterized protein n=1 Tax=Ardenticatena maritima TaxID=872965 RepID=A0A0M8KA71_9CHLR|nr:hypothetical protein ARMA_2454 [Ardenticatena maritima]